MGWFFWVGFFFVVSNPQVADKERQGEQISALVRLISLLFSPCVLLAGIAAVNLMKQRMAKGITPGRGGGGQRAQPQVPAGCLLTGASQGHVGAGWMDRGISGREGACK